MKKKFSGENTRCWDNAEIPLLNIYRHTVDVNKILNFRSFMRVFPPIKIIAIDVRYLAIFYIKEQSVQNAPLLMFVLFSYFNIQIFSDLPR